MSVIFHAIARENSSPKNALIISTVAGSDDAVLSVGASDEQPTQDSPKIDAIERENSSPKNAIVISLFSVGDVANTSLYHMVADERGQAFSDQKMRGGIAG